MIIRIVTGIRMSTSFAIMETLFNAHKITHMYWEEIQPGHAYSFFFQIIGNIIQSKMWKIHLGISFTCLLLGGLAIYLCISSTVITPNVVWNLYYATFPSFFFPAPFERNMYSSKYPPCTVDPTVRCTVHVSYTQVA